VYFGDEADLIATVAMHMPMICRHDRVAIGVTMN
jgi:hypothetical protein